MAVFVRSTLPRQLYNILAMIFSGGETKFHRKLCNAERAVIAILCSGKERNILFQEMVEKKNDSCKFTALFSHDLRILKLFILE